MNLKITDYKFIEDVLKDPYFNIPSSIIEIRQELDMWRRWYVQQDLVNDAAEIIIYKKRLGLLNESLDVLSRSVGSYEDAVNRQYR